MNLIADILNNKLNQHELYHALNSTHSSFSMKPYSGLGQIFQLKKRHPFVARAFVINDSKDNPSVNLQDLFYLNKLCYAFKRKDLLTAQQHEDYYVIEKSIYKHAICLTLQIYFALKKLEQTTTIQNGNYYRDLINSSYINLHRLIQDGELKNDTLSGENISLLQLIEKKHQEFKEKYLSEPVTIHIEEESNPTNCFAFFKNCLCPDIPEEKEEENSIQRYQRL